MAPRVVIVGAGMGGLAAAHHLSVQAAERACPVEIVVLEASSRPGGLLATDTCEGVLLERGPDTLVTHKPAGLVLCERLGLGARIVYPPAGRIDVLHRGRLVPVPPALASLAPARWRPVLSSPLLSWRGRLRALAEPLVAPRSAREDPPREPAEPADESVASLVRRRFGAEVYQRLVEPMLGGIYMADVEHLSATATFPRLVELERERGHLSGWWPRRSGRSDARGRATPGAAKPAPPPTATLAGGLGQIAEALVARLPPGSLRLGQAVEGVGREARGFALRLADRTPLTADAVLIALPAHAAAPLLSELDPTLAQELGQISYACCATVHLAWPRRTVTRPPRSHGFFVPRTAGLPVVAASFIDVKYPERVPGDQVVARVFLGGALHPGALDRTDAELADLAASTLAPLLGLREPPSWRRVWRHPRSMPQRTVGHPARAARLAARLAAHPGLDFTGGALGAYGLPDSIATGEAAADRLLDWI